MPLTYKITGSNAMAKVIAIGILANVKSSVANVTL